MRRARAQCAHDNGTEYVNAALGGYFRSRGILHQKSAPYTPEQNGAAERLNRTIMERVRAMLSDAGLPHKLWAEAAVVSNYVRLRSPATDLGKTPWELFFGKQPDVSNLRTFGARAYVHVPKEQRRKLDARSQRGIMIGYAADCKGYRILLDSGRVAVSRDVLFDEGVAGVSNSVGVGPVAPGVGGIGGVSSPDADHEDDSTEAAEPVGAGAAAPAEPGKHPGDSEQPVDEQPASDRRYPARNRSTPAEWWRTSATAIWRWRRSQRPWRRRARRLKPRSGSRPWMRRWPRWQRMAPGLWSRHRPTCGRSQ